MTHQKVTISDEEMELKLEDFQEWIKNQPELPQNIGKTNHQNTKYFNLILFNLQRKFYSYAI